MGRLTDKQARKKLDALDSKYSKLNDALAKMSSERENEQANKGYYSRNRQADTAENKEKFDIARSTAYAEQVAQYKYIMKTYGKEISDCMDLYLQGPKSTDDEDIMQWISDCYPAYLFFSSGVVKDVADSLGETGYGGVDQHFSNSNYICQAFMGHFIQPYDPYLGGNSYNLSDYNQAIYAVEHFQNKQTETLKKLQKRRNDPFYEFFKNVNQYDGKVAVPEAPEPEAEKLSDDLVPLKNKLDELDNQVKEIISQIRYSSVGSSVIDVPREMGPMIIALANKKNTHKYPSAKREADTFYDRLTEVWRDREELIRKNEKQYSRIKAAEQAEVPGSLSEYTQRMLDLQKKELELRRVISNFAGSGYIKEDKIKLTQYQQCVDLREIERQQKNLEEEYSGYHIDYKNYFEGKPSLESYYKQLKAQTKTFTSDTKDFTDMMNALKKASEGMSLNDKDLKALVDATDKYITAKGNSQSTTVGRERKRLAEEVLTYAENLTRIRKDRDLVNSYSHAQAELIKQVYSGEKDFVDAKNVPSERVVIERMPEPEKAPEPPLDGPEAEQEKKAEVKQLSAQERTELQQKALKTLNSAKKALIPDTKLYKKIIPFVDLSEKQRILLSYAKNHSVKYDVFNEDGKISFSGFESRIDKYRARYHKYENAEYKSKEQDKKEEAFSDIDYHTARIIQSADNHVAVNAEKKIQKYMGKIPADMSDAQLIKMWPDISKDLYVLTLINSDSQLVREAADRVKLFEKRMEDMSRGIFMGDPVEEEKIEVSEAPAENNANEQFDAEQDKEIPEAENKVEVEKPEAAGDKNVEEDKPVVEEDKKTTEVKKESEPAVEENKTRVKEEKPVASEDVKSKAIDAEDVIKTVFEKSSDDIRNGRGGEERQRKPEQKENKATGITSLDAELSIKKEASRYEVICQNLKKLDINMDPSILQMYAKKRGTENIDLLESKVSDALDLMYLESPDLNNSKGVIARGLSNMTADTRDFLNAYAAEFAGILENELDKDNAAVLKNWPTCDLLIKSYQKMYGNLTDQTAFEKSGLDVSTAGNILRVLENGNTLEQRIRSSMQKDGAMLALAEADPLDSMEFSELWDDIDEAALGCTDLDKKFYALGTTVSSGASAADRTKVILESYLDHKKSFDADQPGFMQKEIRKSMNDVEKAGAMHLLRDMKNYIETAQTSNDDELIHNWKNLSNAADCCRIILKENKIKLNDEVRSNMTKLVENTAKARERMVLLGNWTGNVPMRDAAQAAVSAGNEILSPDANTVSDLSYIDCRMSPKQEMLYQLVRRYDKNSSQMQNYGFNITNQLNNMAREAVAMKSTGYNIDTKIATIRQGIKFIEGRGQDFLAAHAEQYSQELERVLKTKPEEFISRWHDNKLAMSCYKEVFGGKDRVSMDPDLAGHVESILQSFSKMEERMSLLSGQEKKMDQPVKQAVKPSMV